MLIKVESPQIKQSWNYEYIINEKTIKESDHKSNPFVENALKYSLEYCLSHTNRIVSSIKI